MLLLSNQLSLYYNIVLLLELSIYAFKIVHYSINSDNCFNNNFTQFLKYNNNI